MLATEYFLLFLTKIPALLLRLLALQAGPPHRVQFMRRSALD